MSARWQRGLEFSKESYRCKQIFGTIESMGVEAQLEKRSPCGNFIVDIEVSLPTAGGRTVTVPVEVDGPTHFLRCSPTKPNGATALRNRHLAVSYGSPALSINVRQQWDHLNEAERNSFLKALLETVV